jgi:hypothetical protein
LGRFGQKLVNACSEHCVVTNNGVMFRMKRHIFRWKITKLLNFIWCSSMYLPICCQKRRPNTTSCMRKYSKLWQLKRELSGFLRKHTHSQSILMKIVTITTTSRKRREQMETMYNLSEICKRTHKK